jgi:gliding motility-associated-like protein
MYKATFRLFFTVFLFALFFKGGGKAFAQAASQTFTYTGANQTFVVPPNVNCISVQAWGAGGGGGGNDTQSGAPGGGGAYATSIFTVIPGTSYTIVVGGGGVQGVNCAASVPGGAGGFGLGNGAIGGDPGSNGCSGPGGGGGGGTGIIDGSGATLLVAGGGGGGGGGGNYGSGANGGGGGVAGSSSDGASVGAVGASSNSNGLAGASTSVDGAGGGGGGGGLIGGGGGGVTGTDYGGSGGGGGTSLGASVTNGSGQTPGNSGSLASLCSTCGLGGNGLPNGGTVYINGGDGLLTISYNSTPLSGTISTTASCGVATASVTPLGGTPDYTYTWSPIGGNSASTTNLTVSGPYTVSITDAYGCTATEVANVVVPAGLNMSVTGPPNPFCDTTKLDWVTWSTVTATSGVGSVSSNLGITLTKPSGGLFTTPSLFASGNFPAQYNLPVNNTTLGNTLAGVFTFCFSKPVIDPQVAFSSIGQAGITVPIVTSVPYTVIWPGINMSYPSSNVLEGTEGYTIIQFPGQHTCISFDYLTSENYCNLVFGIRDTNCQTTPLCKGSSATYTASGGISYTWSPNVALSATTGSVVTANPTSYQTYTIIGTDVHGCMDTAITSIMVNPVPVPTISSFTNVSCFGGNNGAAVLNVTNGTTPYTYSWTNGNTSVKDSMLVKGTYSVTVTDVNGCKGSTSQLISQPALLKDSISDSSNISCFGIPNGSATVGVIGGTTAYTYSWNTTPVQLTATASNLPIGSYTVTVTDANHCVTTATVTLTQPPALTLTATKTNVTCNGLSTGSATATATGGTPPYTYGWNTTPPQISATGIATGLAVVQYTAGVQDAKGCQDTVSINITQPAVLVNSIVSSLNDSCFGHSKGNAVTAAVGGTGPYNYSWNTTPSQTTSNAINLPAGTYTATATDAHGCQDTAVVTITQPTAVTATISSFKNDSCFGTSNGSATVSMAGGTAPRHNSWSTSPVQVWPTAINLPAGTYTVLVTDSLGCTATNTVTISQPPVLTFTTSQVNVSCNGLNDASITTTAGGGTPGTGYIYALEQPLQVSPTGIFTGLVAGQYTTGVIDANGCRDSVTIIITQPALLVDSLVSQKNDSCFGNSNGIAITGSSGGTLPYIYSWNTTPIQSTANASNLPAGTYTATLTDAHNCQDTAVVTITQPAVLTSSIVSSKNDSCFGNSNGNAVVTGNGGTRPYLFIWDTTPIQSDSTASNLPMGSYTVAIKDIKGCVTTSTVNITQPPLLTLTSSPKSICISNTATLTANSGGGTTPYTYLWNSVAGTQTDTVKPITTTTYSVKVVDIKGCADSTTVTVFVRDSLRLPQVYQSGPICSGQSAKITATGTGGDSLWTYTWNPGGLIGDNFNVMPATTTIYTVTITDACKTPPFSKNVTVVVDSLPQINFNSDVQNGCYPLCVQFTNATTNAVKYTWTLDGHNTDTTTNPLWCYKSSGVFTVSLTATSNKGCISKFSNQNMITVYPRPKAQFNTSADPTILEPNVQFTDASYAPGSSITNLFWQTFGDGTDSTSTLPKPVHTYKDTGTYCITLIATNTFGCKDTTTECIFIKPYFTLYIPNAFSPNNDGDNDIFIAVGDYIFDFDMKIFDRWGNLVYHSTQLNNGWNGLMKSGAAIEDVYVYVISATDYHNHSYSYKGTVTLLK